ncbi:MAG: tRNA pseudouridine(54/55) synthase Pus10 [Candidatus Caldarchaeum sp.]
MTSIAQLTVELLKSGALCDYCLGRQFARLGYGLSNRERGRALKVALLMEAVKNRDEGLVKLLAENGGVEEAALHLGMSKPEGFVCGVCGGSLSEKNLSEMAEIVVKMLEGYEFTTFLVGASVPSEVREREDSLRAALGLSEAEDIKNDVSREVGKLLAAITEKKADHKHPDITIVVDIFSKTCRIISNPLFLKGRYLKHSRQLPQSPWSCRRCWGKGCHSCGFTGREYPTSVAELVGEPARRLFQAERYKFHAAGREDVDALVQNEGRPFVLELSRPRVRSVPFNVVEETINGEARGMVEVRVESLASRKEVRTLKSTSALTSKTYEVRAFFEDELDAERVKRLEEFFRNRVVEQRTPTRVLGRRSDRMRRKTVYWVEATLVEGREAVFKIRCQGGLYVKELVTGDSGRTVPSFAELLQAVPTRLELTVLAVETQP